MSADSAAVSLSPPARTLARDSGVVAASSPPPAQSGSSDDNAGTKKPAWSVTPASEGGVVVMGADLWPPLSESTKKLSPSNSSTDLGSAPLPQNQTTSKANYSVTPPNHGQATRQTSMIRDVVEIAQANAVFCNQNLLPREGLNNHSIALKTSLGGGGSSEIAGRELGIRNPNGEHHHHHPRSSFRRGNGGNNGSHQNYGGRRSDQDRGNYDWNHQRGFNGRDAALQPGFSPRGYVRSPLVSAPYVHPQRPTPMRPFMNPMVMPDMSMYYFTQGVPYVAPVPPPMYFPVSDPQMQTNIVRQIDYYFSNANLVKDSYLRKNMDKDGWVPIALVAGFKKVKQLTNNIELILDVVKSNSSLVEVEGDKIRRRDDYMRWIMPPSMELSPNIAGLYAHFRGVTLDESARNAAMMFRPSSVN